MTIEIAGALIAGSSTALSAGCLAMAAYTPRALREGAERAGERLRRAVRASQAAPRGVAEAERI